MRTHRPLSCLTSLGVSLVAALAFAGEPASQPRLWVSGKGGSIRTKLERNTSDGLTWRKTVSSSRSPAPISRILTSNDHPGDPMRYSGNDGVPIQIVAEAAVRAVTRASNANRRKTGFGRVATLSWGYLESPLTIFPANDSSKASLGERTKQVVDDWKYKKAAHENMKLLRHEVETAEARKAAARIN